MILNQFGKIAENELLISSKIRKELILDKYIIMPNHIHCIVCINYEKCLIVNSNKTVNTHNMENGCKKIVDAYRIVDAHGRAHLRGNAKLNRQKQSISSFIAGYKSAVINKIDDFIDKFKLKIVKFNKNNPLWQRNFYDHVIRNEISYLRISKYILENPIRYENRNN